jgi:D-amino-acid dehydrogenase
MRMTHLVVGGGLIGLSTARALLDRGERVVVLEAREGVGLETSFANGGMLTPSLPEPWNGPGIGRHLLRALFDRRAPVRFSPAALPSLLGWGIRFLRNSTLQRYRASVLANYALCRYSVDSAFELVERLGLAFDFSDVGTLCVFDNEEELDERWDVCRKLMTLGMRAERIGAAQIANYEPALGQSAQRYAGGIVLPDDARGDAHLFCRGLAQSIRAAGGEIHANTAVSAIAVRQGRVHGVQTGAQFLAADRVVVAAGARSPALLGPLGIRCPVKPAKGYSITIERDSAGDLPKRSILDESAHAVVGSLGSRLRVVGTAEFAGFDPSIPAHRIDGLFRVLHKVLPDVAVSIERDAAACWAGFRPMSADGRPIIGPTPVEGLYLNAGHGALGWTMAVGSGLVLADLMAGRRPAVDPSPFLPGSGR